jgi:hypothetical protein
MVQHIADVEICRFWTEKLMEVSSPSFRIAPVSRMKKMKTEEAKNNVFKPHGKKGVFNPKNNIYIYICFE